MKQIYRNPFLIFLFIVFTVTNIFAQSPAHVSFPAAQQENLTVCNSTAKVVVQIDFNTDAAGQNTTEAIVNLQLGNALEYSPGTVSILSGSTANYSIVDDGGTANNPQFKISISSGTIQNRDRVVFSIDQSADCQIVNSNTIFESKAEVTVGSLATAPITSSAFTVSYPEITLTQPAPNNNAILNTQYTRTFTIENGADGCADAIYFTIERVNAATELVSLTLGGFTITPSSIVGDIEYYEISGVNLTTDEELCNGEVLTFTETYLFKSCQNSTETNYAAGWGCDSDPTNWCETSNGVGTISIQQGVGEFTAGDLVDQKIGYTNMCSPFTVRSTYTNSSTGNATAAGFYDLTVLRGKYASGTSMSGLTDIVTISNVTIGGNAVPFSMNASNELVIEIKDHFTSDPDGPGGLEDLDNDGFFDDLPAGSSFETEFTWTFNCGIASTCGDKLDPIIRNIAAELEYHKICDPTIITSEVVPGSTGLGISYHLLNANGTTTPNVSDGVPFNVRLSAAHFLIYNDFHTANSKYKYEFTLPTGVTVAPTPNVTWTKGEVTDNNTPSNHTYTQNGNVVTIESPDTDFGYANIDLVYTCGTGGPISMPYKLNYINDDNCDCFKELACGTIDIAAYCPGTCPQGPEITIPIVRRADNSLGWTDRTMTTRQSAANISAFELSRALYKDEIEIHTTATQNGATNNFYVRLELPLSQWGDRKLEPLGVDVIIKRGGAEIVNTTVANVSETESTSTDQIIDYNLNAILPSGGLLDGDELEVTGRYQVRVNGGLPQENVQSGGAFYCYNEDIGGGKVFCNSFIAEMYLAGTHSLNGANAYQVDGCQPNTIGGQTNYMARRFNTSGTKFTNEFRPAMYIESIEVTMPSGYDLQEAEFRLNGESFGGVNPSSIVIIPTSVNGNILTFTNDGSWLPLELSVQNKYGGYIPLKVIANCLTNEEETIEIKTNIIDYYYHSGGLNTIPNEFYDDIDITWRKIKNPNKANITLQDQTGNIQSTSTSESFQIKMQSTGNSKAPYNWIAIDNIPGVTITQVSEVSTGNVIPATSYAGGNIYYLNQTGLDIGESADYQIDFDYTTCSPTTINVQGGWNCSDYPTDPSAYLCGGESLDLNFTPQLGGLEINTVTEPTASVNLCDPIPFEYRVNSTSSGNIINNTFTLSTITGLTPENGSFEVEFPINSGNWEAIAPTVNASSYTVDMTQHSNYTVAGVNGTLNDGGVSDSRKIGIRFNMLMDCNFVSGSSFSYKASASSRCGNPANGSNVIYNTSGIDIDGTSDDYDVSLNLFKANGSSGSFDNCGGQITLQGSYQVTTSGSAGENPYINIQLPLGMSYVSGSFTPITPINSPGASYIGVSNLASGEEVVRIDVPGSLNSGDVVEYVIQVEDGGQNYLSCGNHAIKMVSIDESNSVSCGSSVNCPSVRIETGNFDFNFTIDKAGVELSSLTTSSIMNGSNEDITAFFEVSNTHSNFAINSGLIVEAYFDANSNGVIDASDMQLSTKLLANGIPEGGLVSDSISFTASPNQVCNILLAITHENNRCICNEAVVPMNIPANLELIAGDDKNACSVNDLVTIGQANNTGYAYVWQGANPPETGYLSNSSISDPDFSYDGPSISAPMSIVYTLTVERAGGCTSIDEVKVDLEPSQGAFFNINTPGYTNMPCEGNDVSLVTPVFPNGSYVWTKDNVSIPTATTNQHDIIGLQTADAGYYKAVVTYGRCSSEGGILIDPGLCGGALAVQLSSFSVNCISDGGAIVEWVTASETNSLDFVISKSRDMAQWTLVDTVKGQGFSNTNVEYALFDSLPYQGLSYYKLTQRDIDGTEEVFPIISNFCNLDRENQMEIYPNPSNGEFNIDIHLNESINCQIVISDISGRVMSLKNHELKKGTNTLIYSSSLMRGVYIVRLLENNSSISSKKLIIE